MSFKLAASSNLRQILRIPTKTFRDREMMGHILFFEPQQLLILPQESRCKLNQNGFLNGSNNIAYRPRRGMKHLGAWKC